MWTRSTRAVRRCASTLAALGIVACGSGPSAVPGTQVRFDLGGQWGTAATFFDFPYPSDLRLGPSGAPDLAGLPNAAHNAVFEAIRRLAEDRRGFPVVPGAYFRFDGPLADRDIEEVIPAEATSPVLLVDVDEGSPERGRLFPTVATVVEPDAYTPSHLLAVAAQPGMVLAGGRRYAFVVLRTLGDAAARPLGVPRDLVLLRLGQTPAGPRGATARDLYAPLWPALRSAGVDPAAVAAATVFTTGDVVRELADLSDPVVAGYSLEITDLHLDPDDGDHPRYCELLGIIRYPQFQRGTPPFAAAGTFAVDASGRPVRQRDEEAPVVITLPKAPMPPAGYPLLVYLHGSGGLSSQVVDRGSIEQPGGDPVKGEGPAHVVAPLGIAAAASAMPLNPERYPAGSELVYLDFANPGAFRDTYRQGVLETRLFVDALRRLQIPPATLGACGGPTLPAGVAGFGFDTSRLALMGQSMGSMFAAMVGAVEPRVGAVLPTGTGGYWSFFVPRTKLISASPLSTHLGTRDDVSFLHPALQLLETGWEVSDPIVYAPRVGRDPLPGHPVRHVYQPMGRDDSFFPAPVQDAMAVAYANRQAGARVWSSMEAALASAGLGGIEPYPVGLNRESLSGEKYTGVVVQYEGDGLRDPHAIAFQLDEVKYQYGCFLWSFLRGATAVVPAPAALGTPCSE